MNNIIMITPLSRLAIEAIADFKLLNAPITTSERILARKTITVTTAIATRLGLIKTPSSVEKFVLSFKKEDSKNLKLWNKTVVFLCLFGANTLIKFENETIQNTIDLAKIVLWEELIELGLDKLNVEEYILNIGKTATDIQQA